MSLFIPEPVRELMADALERVPRPFDREVIARVFQVVEKDPELLARYQQISLEYSGAWTVNKFGGMAVRELLGWEKEDGNPRPATRFTTLIKTYTRLIPPGVPRQDLTGGNTQADLDESGGEAGHLEPFVEVEEFPEIRDWVTPTQAAEIIGITRAGVHKKILQREFQSVHRLGDRPHLVLLRSEAERMRAMRLASKEDEIVHFEAVDVVPPVERRTAGKTTIPEFLGRCSPEERDYYEQLFACLDDAGVTYWMGDKGFSISRIFWGYPTFECRRHGLYLQMDQVPAERKRIVRNLVAAATGFELDYVAEEGSVQLHTKDLSAEAVCRITQAALGLAD